jgi:hypothetical protein
LNFSTIQDSKDNWTHPKDGGQRAGVAALCHTGYSSGRMTEDDEGTTTYAVNEIYF